jgi:N-dimethylarginine dimethylaminohydrolase
MTDPTTPPGSANPPGSADAPRCSVDSETGVLREVLVCRPEHFEWLPVNTIGRHSVESGATLDRVAVLDQHEQLVDALRGAGALVRHVEPQPHLPYMVYTRDSSVVTPWGPVITQMRKPPRWGEFAYLMSTYEALGSPVWRYITHGTVEGGDVSVAVPGLLVVGASGVRTDAEGAAQLCSWFAEADWETLVVPFDDHFCHLDLIFAMAGRHAALCCLDALPDGFTDTLARHGIEPIPISYREAMSLGANVLALGGDRVISPSENASVNHRLTAAGFEVITPDLGEILRGGGSAHCTTMPLRRDPER